MNREVVLTYLEALCQSTKKKGIIIDELIELTRRQEKLVQIPMFDLEEFTLYLNEKDKSIQEIAMIDNGFTQTFERIKDSLIQDKEWYQSEIEQLQKLIAVVTTKAVELQAMEMRNKVLVDRRIAEGKQKIKRANIGSEVASSYYRNMINTHYDQSYFMDKKK